MSSIGMNESKKVLISIVGPTAVGKTNLSIKLASRLDTEIISMDSRQFYREMTLGTAKPSALELKKIKHHFIDNLSIDDSYSVGDFEQESLEVLKRLFESKNVVVAVGGSGLFCKALWEGLDDMPEIAHEYRQQLNDEYALNGLAPLISELESVDPIYFKAVDLNNPQRIIRALEVTRATGLAFSSFRFRKKSNSRDFMNVKVGLELDRASLYQRIDDRMDQMIDAGLFKEAESLYPHKHRNALLTVGYREIFDFMDQKYSYDEAVRLLKRNSRHYAKRQLTWFRKDPEIQWYNAGEDESILEVVLNTHNLD